MQSYYAAAARLGDPDAQNDLAFCFANGKGCKKDRKEAAKWYRAAVCVYHQVFRCSTCDTYLPGCARCKRRWSCMDLQGEIHVISFFSFFPGILHRYSLALSATFVVFSTSFCMVSFYCGTCFFTYYIPHSHIKHVY